MSAVYWLARGGSTLAKWTPRPIRNTLGRAIGGGSNLAWPSKRLVTRLNMAQVTGRPVNDPYVRRLAFASWVNYGRYAADFMNFANLDVNALERSLQDLSEGVASWKDHIKTGLEAGRGVIIASAHFGNWDFAGALLARIVEVSAVVESFSDERLNTLLQSQREDKGLRLIMLGNSVRPLLRALQKNQIAALVVDRPVPKEEGVAITFFGRTAYVPNGPALLAYMSGAAIVPGYVWYGPRGKHYVRAFPPIVPRKGADRTEEIARLTQCLYDSFEEMVRAYPSQWYMFRQFWPT